MDTCMSTVSFYIISIPPVGKFGSFPVHAENIIKIISIYVSQYRRAVVRWKDKISFKSRTKMSLTWCPKMHGASARWSQAFYLGYSIVFGLVAFKKRCVLIIKHARSICVVKWFN